MKRSFYYQGIIVFLVLVTLGINRPAGQIMVAQGRALPRADGYQVIGLVNQVRAAYGLPALQANSALMAAAQGHSDYQASIGSITHSGAGGSTPNSRAAAAGYGGGAKIYISENIYGGNNASPSTAVNWWQSDPPHLQTMINPNATDAGAGVAESGKMVYYTLDVGYVSGAPGSGSLTTPVAAGTKPPTVPPIIPVQTATPAADGAIWHVVQPGQALWNIAAAYQVSIADLMALNGLTENSFIFPGDKILVRRGEAVTPTIEVTTTLTEPVSTLTAMPTFTLPPVIGQVNAVVPDSAKTSPPAPALPSPAVEGQVERQTDAVQGRSDPMLWIIVGLFTVGVGLIFLGSLKK